MPRAAGVLRACLTLLGLVTSACQLVAPLPDIEDDASGGSGSSSVSAATGPASSSSGGPMCGAPGCDAYCASVSSACGQFAQYPNADVCCAACEALGPIAMTCREVPAPNEVNAWTCTHAGPLGESGVTGCAANCQAVCDLFAASCDEVQHKQVEECPAKCEADFFDGNFDLGKPGRFACRLREVLLSFEGTKEQHKSHCEAASHCESDD